MSNPVGDLAHRIEIFTPGNPSPEQIRTIGALCDVYGWAEPTVQPIFPQVSSHENLFEAGPQHRLDARIEDMGLKQLDEKLGPKAINALRREGLATVRDLLVVGADFIDDIRNVSSKTVALVERALWHQFPEVPLPATLEPATVAKFCPSLQSVTWLALGRGWSDRIWYTGISRVPSLQDIIDKPYPKLQLKPYGREAERNKAVGLQTELRAAAREYARQYHRALGAAASAAARQEDSQ